MKLARLYQCLGDETRLRLLHLLSYRPLCVCHLQEILRRPQVQVSQHLARMKKDGLVQAHRHQNWMIYSLPTRPPEILTAHLECLQEAVSREPLFKKDLVALGKVQAVCGWIDELMPVQDKSRSKNRFKSVT